MPPLNLVFRICGMFWRRFVRYNFPFRVVRIWPLLLSAIALGIFVYISPLLYESALYEFGGGHTEGWYSDFAPERPADSDPYYSYAYRVDRVTYSGTSLYDDALSDVYFRKVGDPIWLTYLKRKPWVSTLEPTGWNFKIGSRAAALFAVVFISGIWLSVARRPKLEPY